MIRLLTALFIGFILVLGSISIHSKSIELLGHVAIHHKHDHHSHSQKNTKTQHHHHDAELASLNVPLAVSSQGFFTELRIPHIEFIQSFIVINQLTLKSISSSIFRPPIA